LDGSTPGSRQATHGGCPSSWWARNRALAAHPRLLVLARLRHELAEIVQLLTEEVGLLLRTFLRVAGATREFCGVREGGLVLRAGAEARRGGRRLAGAPVVVRAQGGEPVVVRGECGGHGYALLRNLLGLASFGAALWRRRLQNLKPHVLICHESAAATPKAPSQGNHRAHRPRPCPSSTGSARCRAPRTSPSRTRWARRPPRRDRDRAGGLTCPLLGVESRAACP